MVLGYGKESALGRSTASEKAWRLASQRKRPWPAGLELRGKGGQGASKTSSQGPTSAGFFIKYLWTEAVPP